jgi:dienelactone hydrolase
MRLHRRVMAGAALIALAGLSSTTAAQAAGPQPGTPEYIARDTQNIADAYGRQTQVQLTPTYLQALVQGNTQTGLEQLAQQAATPNRIAITPGNVFPGWNEGNPYREGWNGKRGLMTKVAYTNRYGALIRGDVFAPLPGARDPYTGKKLKPPYPGVVITEGSVQGSERMYWWLAQDLAERGYVVLTYDVQGQGTSETLPHQGDQVDALPFCNPFATPGDGEQFGCPGVPAQQSSNFVYGTEDALDFFLSQPSQPYKNPHGSDAKVNSFNPYWKLFDRSPDKKTDTPGRTTRVAIIGHSLGAFAISYVQGVDKRVQTAVALDKLQTGGGMGAASAPEAKPVVPSLGIQSEYGFNVAPYFANPGLGGAPSGDPTKAPDPKREEKTGFDGWRKAGVDTMVIVPRASTHLEYTDIPLALPASRYGQALTSVYTQDWLDRYLKHKSAQPLFAEQFRYLEPVAPGKWAPVTLKRGDRLSFYFCSGWSIKQRGTGKLLQNSDIAGVGGCS